MPCRIGITTRPEDRRREWEREVSGLRNWVILETCNTKLQAQLKEDHYREFYGCVGSAGGEDARGPWFVYKFDYDS